MDPVDLRPPRLLLGLFVALLIEAVVALTVIVTLTIVMIVEGFHCG